MQEVDAQTVDDGAELADLVKARLERPPVVLGAPVVHHVHEVGERHALVPSAWAGCRAIDHLGFRQSCGGQPRSQVLEVGVGGVGFEGVHVAGVTVHEIPRPGRAGVATAPQSRGAAASATLLCWDMRPPGHQWNRLGSSANHLCRFYQKSRSKRNQLWWFHEFRLP